MVVTRKSRRFAVRPRSRVVVPPRPTPPLLKPRASSRWETTGQRNEEAPSFAATAEPPFYCFLSVSPSSLSSLFYFSRDPLGRPPTGCHLLPPKPKKRRGARTFGRGCAGVLYSPRADPSFPFLRSALAQRGDSDDGGSLRPTKSRAGGAPRPASRAPRDVYPARPLPARSTPTVRGRAGGRTSRVTGPPVSYGPPPWTLALDSDGLRAMRG